MAKTYQRSEVADHNDADTGSVWIIISDKVYDVSKFISEHPGGEEVILELAGKDASEAFEDVGHSTDARGMLTQYYIGDIAESEKDQGSSMAPTQENVSSSGGGMGWIIPVTVVVLGVALAYRFFSQQS